MEGNTAQALVASNYQGCHEVATIDDFATSAAVLLQRKKTLQTVMEQVMIKDEHFGVIPGCGKKPSLLKPGAEAIASTFRLCPRYIITKSELGGGHREYEILCELYNPAGGFVGSGVGSATTMETKYRFRVGGGEITEVPVPKAYWDRRKNDPKGAAKVLRDAAHAAGIEGESFGTQKDDSGQWMVSTKTAEKVEHDNPADYYNTVLKMAKKRAFVDAVLTATGASDIFTQDIEDMPEVIPQAKPSPKSQTQAQAQPTPQEQQNGAQREISQQQIKAIMDAAEREGIAMSDLLSDARARFQADDIDDLSKLWAHEGMQLLQAINSRQIGTPTATSQMDQMPQGF
ncbi:hypothetical protein dsx2_2608 [Desulfovibrio sp. X2]|uniref:hypothetical protein n=1 Tax=Desulfovibrio sp. X2 TaxID=941449 RepID=UPI000358D531|nr:hypothetical protein [Desulfovibrio sp. X2]EPR42691.1 hypothetical protein dsx2_2608 [Desulfovibrio sp. X2]